MTQKKYKKGDRVVVTEKVSRNDYDIGTALTIINSTKELHRFHGQAYDVVEHAIGYYENQLEFASIYYSPLRQALL